MVLHRDGFERRLVVGDRMHRVVAVVEGAMLRVDVDGAAHAVFRDDGGVVRAGGPAFVLSVLVQPGDRVAEGDPLAVVESMKMENTITAPFAGTIASVEAAANVQVERARQSSASRPPTSMRATRPALSTSPASPPSPPAPFPASGYTTRYAATSSATTSTPARWRRC